MFLVRLSNFDPLVDATSILAQISKEADVKFTRSRFSIVASHRSPRFFVTLQMSFRFFTDYSVDQDHVFRTSLEAFHDAMLDGGSFPSMTIHLLETSNQMILRFENSSHGPELHHELVLSPSQGVELGQVEHGKFFSMISKELRRIIKLLPLFQEESVCITVTSSRLKFSVASTEITLTQADGRIKIVGYEGEGETQYRVILRPMLFFLNLTHQANTVSFYKTTNSCSVMNVPAFGWPCQYVVYFPQM